MFPFSFAFSSVPVSSTDTSSLPSLGGTILLSSSSFTTCVIDRAGPPHSHHASLPPLSPQREPSLLNPSPSPRHAMYTPTFAPSPLPHPTPSRTRPAKHADPCLLFHPTLCPSRVHSSTITRARPHPPLLHRLLSPPRPSLPLLFPLQPTPSPCWQHHLPWQRKPALVG